jgi:hypothetical protein
MEHAALRAEELLLPWSTGALQWYPAWQTQALGVPRGVDALMGANVSQGLDT